MKIKVDRDSVCMGDDMEGHSKIYQLDHNATYEDLFNMLKEDHYFPNIAGNNVVWVLTTKRFEWIFSYFTKTDKFSEGLCEKYLRNICDPSGEVFLQYYSSPEKWKNKILDMYHGDSYAMWRDGWDNELKYCDEIIDIVGSMNHDIKKFIPRDMAELYATLQKEDLKGKLTMEDGWLIWRLPNNIIIKIFIWNHPHEGYIDTYYLKNGKEMYLTHWHPMDDEVYSDLMDINNGRTIWVKKKSFFGDQLIIMDRKEYETMSDKKKRKYHFLEGV